MNSCICALAKHENNYINDWTNWHLNLGFDHIYIYDNNDKDYESIESRIDQLNKVTIYKVPGREKDNIQKYYYDKFYQEHKNEFNWCAFLDCDEFINLENYKDINEFLSKFSKYEVIRLNERLFGDDNRIDRDINIPIYNDIKIRISEQNCKGKFIIKGGLNNVKIESPHFPYILGNIPKQINPDFKTGWWKYFVPESNSVYINHYKTKTLSEFIDQKLNRGDAVWPTWNPTLEYFWKVNKKTQEKLDYLKQRGLL